ELLGAAFSSIRSRVVIASKVGFSRPVRGRLVDRVAPMARPVIRRLGLRRNATRAASLSQDFSSARIFAGIEASLRRLRTDYLDLYMLHGLPDDWEPALDALQRLKQRGMIRHFGVSCATPEDVGRCFALPGVAVLQVNLSLLHQEAICFLPEAQRRCIG